MTDDNRPARTSTIREKPVRVLIVDDHVDSADMVAMILEKHQHSTAVAYTAEQALEAALSFEPDVVLLDLSLGGYSGYELAEDFQSHEQLRSCRLVALTGHADESSRRRSEAAGFHRHLAKPFDLDALLEAVAGKDERPTWAPPKGWSKKG